MYLLTMVNLTGKKSQTYIQLRDKNMRLLGFFHLSQLESFLKTENKLYLFDQISQLIYDAVPGKLYLINNKNNEQSNSTGN